MFILYVIIPPIIWILALLSVWFYPLSRESARKLREELEARRGYI